MVRTPYRANAQCRELTDSNLSTWNDKNPSSCSKLEPILVWILAFHSITWCAVYWHGNVTIRILHAPLATRREGANISLLRVGGSGPYCPLHLSHSHAPRSQQRVLLMHDAETQTRALSLRADTLKRCDTIDLQRELNPQLIPLQDEFNHYANPTDICCQLYCCC